MKTFYTNLLILTACFTFNALAYAEESSSSSSSEETSDTPVTNNQYYINGYSKGMEAGMAEGKKFCETNPNSCGISRYTNIDDELTQKEIEEKIKAECLDNPASCGIKTAEQIQKEIEEKIKAECLDNPASCGINTGNYDGSTEEGIAKCKNDPQSCGIPVCSIPVEQDSTCSTTLQQGIQQGIQLCKDDPQSYGIPIEQDGTCSATLEQGIQQGIQQCRKQCKDDPAYCEIIIENGYFSMSDGKLFLPRVDVPTPLNGTMTILQVEMQMIPGRNPLSFSVSDYAQIDN
ncbi:MAG: hypothetical protein KAI83_16735 [Thiomargarita sp.]|nr:hypothetical protein [Thiomargarita sp.]